MSSAHDEPPPEGRARAVVRALLAAAMTAVGALHFVTPEPFVRIVPRELPAPLALVYLSGVAEVAGGLGLLWPRTRRAAAWGLVALYVAVFPANVNMAVRNISLGPEPIAPALLWARLPLQLVFIALAAYAGELRRPRAKSS